MKHNNYTTNYSKGASIQNPANLAGISSQLFRGTILDIFSKFNKSLALTFNKHTFIII